MGGGGLGEGGGGSGGEGGRGEGGGGSKGGSGSKGGGGGIEGAERIRFTMAERRRTATKAPRARAPKKAIERDKLTSDAHELLSGCSDSHE
jgi:hypothetical protein